MKNMKSFIRPAVGNLFINPGTGPVDDATEANARVNIRQFITDLGIDGVRVRRLARADYGDGRYAFRLYYKGRRCEVQMPGLPLDQTRWQKGLDPWEFPRLYVEGSSWLWSFAVGCAQRDLLGDED
jgi:hypothetical protein